MIIEYDTAKSEQNRINRGLPFDLVEQLDWHSALVWPDIRKDYGEERWASLVPMGDRLYFVCCTWRQDTMRVISFRKANNREIDRYEKEIYP